MTVELIKGDRFNLSQEAPNLKRVAVALGWTVTEAGQDYDIDASVFMLGDDGKVPDEKYFVFYNNLTSLDNAVRHSGDNRTGQVQGDDETIFVDLTQVDSRISEIVFIVTLHKAQENNQNFSQVQNAFIRLYNQETGSELVRYNLKEVFFRETALEFGRLYKKNGEWRFQAVGQGYNTGLQSFVDKYYLQSEERSIKTDESTLDDAEVLRQFSERVDQQLRVENEVPGSELSLQMSPDNSEVNANLESDHQDQPITAEEFWQRYEAGERDFTGINLAGVDLSEKTLQSNVSLIEANLSDANLTKVNFSQINLTRANLQRANLTLANLPSSDLTGANLSQANLTKTNLVDAKLIQANLNQAKLSEANLKQTNLTIATLKGASLNLTNLTSAKLTGADLSQAKLNQTNLSRADLEEANFTQAIFAGVNLSGSNLKSINVTQVSLVGQNLSCANLIGQNLSGCNLSGVNFCGAKLNGANLSSSDLRSADLRSANLEKANLKGAKIAGANLQNAILTGAIMPDGSTHE